MADEQRRKWLEIFRRFLGKPCTKNYKHIISDLISVSSGLKPSLLFDYTYMDFEKAREMLHKIRENELLRGHLDVICLGQDLFIANLDTLVRRLKEILRNDSFFLVDITGSLPEPRVASTKTYCEVADQFVQTVNLLDGRLRDLNVTDGRRSGPSLTHLKPQDGWNLTSLFGFLLTYPVIYWFAEPAASSDLNCLALNPLEVHTVELKIQSPLRNVVSPEDWSWLSGDTSLKHTLFSFSVPVALASDCGHFIEKWKVSLLETSESLCIGDFVDIGSHIVVLKQVAL